MLTLNNQDSSFLVNNDKLCEFLLCNVEDLQCIMGQCKKCNKFISIDSIKFSELKCSTTCIEENLDCISLKHTIKIKQFETIKYPHKGIMKKKISLVDKYVTLNEIPVLFKFKLKDFPRHRFTINHTEKTICQLKENLTESEVIKIQDFSENYTCLLHDEVQSMHWT